MTVLFALFYRDDVDILEAADPLFIPGERDESDLANIASIDHRKKPPSAKSCGFGLGIFDQLSGECLVLGVVCLFDLEPDVVESLPFFGSLDRLQAKWPFCGFGKVLFVQPHGPFGYVQRGKGIGMFDGLQA